MATTRWILLLAALLVAAAESARPSPRASRLPESIERFLASVVRPTSAERDLLLRGSPIAKLLESDPGLEVAVFGAIWIKAAPAKYVAAVKDIERFERGGAFRITRRISAPPRLEDFAEMTLPEEDVRDLKACRVGDCQVKLGQSQIERFRASVDWTKPTAKADAERVFRQIAFESVAGYLEGGNGRLAVYRDHLRPASVASEFESMLERMPSLAESLPSVRQYLLGYPNAVLPGSVDFLYWQETTFGLKPTIRISHVVIEESEKETVVASKMLYASHYFCTGLELRVLVPDPARGSGFWFINVNRSRSDGLSGFTGRLIRGRVRSGVADGLLSALTATKIRLESQTPQGASSLLH
ncbi:MAG TPA: hypothetical protein VGK32_01640 [Vicinamibacterales bacterium]|jgi:hypothetical protein